jgi:hypothetical protein
MFGKTTREKALENGSSSRVGKRYGDSNAAVAAAQITKPQRTRRIFIFGI